MQANLPENRSGLTCSAYVEIIKGTLRGRADIRFERLGITLMGCPCFEKDGSRWVSPPSREWVGKDGKKNYEPFLDFGGKERQRLWSDAAVNAVDAFLKGGAQ